MNPEWTAEREQWQERVRRRYRPLRPELQHDLEGWLHPEAREIPSLPVADASPPRPLVRPFRDDWCRGLIDEVRGLQRFADSEGLRIPTPNSMHGRGLVLDDVGFEGLLAELCSSWVSPLARSLFTQLDIDHLDEHHGFIAEYQAPGDEGLSLHVDDSELTLNLCLGEQFEGGELHFLGPRCFGHLQSPPTLPERQEIPATPGVGVLHLGADRHFASRIHSGHRLHLILWCRSTTQRRVIERSCPPWCGDHRCDDVHARDSGV